MSQRLTFGSLKRQSRALSVLNVCDGDPRIAQWLNAFEQRSWGYGRWWGSVQLVRFCITNSCVVLPREIAVIEASTLNGYPMQSNNIWGAYARPHYEWNGCGSSCSCCGCASRGVEDRDSAASFLKTTGVNKKIKVYIGGASDIGKKIIFQGNDANGNWVRTSIDGVQADGEEVTLANPSATTTTIWGPGAPTAVIKDPTDYPLQVYSVNQDDAVELKIAIYQPSETEPMYRVYYVPNACRSGACTTNTLLAVASLQHIPIERDNDFLLYQNIAAYQDGMYSEKLREEGDDLKADRYFFGTVQPAKNARGVMRFAEGMGALGLLRAELRKQTGDKTEVRFEYDGVSLAGFR